MFKLLRFEFRRIRSNLFFWLLTLYCVVWPVFVATFYRLLFSLNVDENGFSFGPLNLTGDEKKYISWIILSAFFAEMPKFMALFTCLYIGKDQSDGFVRNKVISGHSRLSVFMSNNIAQSLVTVFWCVVYICFAMLGLLINGLGPMLNGGEVFARLGTAIAVLLVLSALFTSVAFAFRNRAVPVVLSILFTMVTSGVCMATGMFALPKAASDSYAKHFSERVELNVEQGYMSREAADKLIKDNTADKIRGGKAWYIFHPVYQATNAGFQKDYQMPNGLGLTSGEFVYNEKIDYTDYMVFTALAQEVLLDKETLSKMDGIQTSYATKNLEYVVKSVIWYAVFTGAGFILFKRRDLF